MEVKKSPGIDLRKLLSARPLVLKRNGMHVCLHDAFSGEVLANQASVELIQVPDSLPIIRVDFICDGQRVRIDGDK
jgi:hypothetical protein